MHDEENPSSSGSSSLVASEDKDQCLRADVQQRDILAALCWVGAGSAVDQNEALAKLVKERTGHANGVSSNVDSCDHSRQPR